MTNFDSYEQDKEQSGLGEARSLFWTIRQLTSNSAAKASHGRSYLFELHQIASKGLETIDRLIECRGGCDLEKSL